MDKAGKEIRASIETQKKIFAQASGSDMAALVLIFATTHANPPHIITILADDMGWYDSAINNPDSFMTQQGFGAIAKDGITLARHYAYKYCSPSRRSFLSGRFPNHISGAQAPICSNFLPLQFTLLPERLKDVGYSTHMVGKGHLGYMTTDHMPINRGFDSHVGYLAAGEGYNWGNTGQTCQSGCTGYCKGSNITNNMSSFCKKDMWHNEGTGWDIVDDISYSTHFYTQRAVQLILAHEPTRPFYLHLTYQAVHHPFQEPPLSEQIPNGSIWWDHTWGSMLNALDKGIANVTTALRAQGMWQNTLVVLVADNGGDHAASPSDPTGRTTMANNWPLRGTKLTAWEGGTRVAGVVGGGFVPVKLRGSSSDALMHMADWVSGLQV
jgi:arylsulfatase A-like enzyme